MANDNNNINELVVRSDSDPTSELDLTDALKALDTEIEVDEDTYNFDDVHPAVGKYSESELLTELQEQLDKTEALEFEIEQLQSRRRGLEEEIKAREEIANSVKIEVDEARDRVTEANKEVQIRNEENETLKSQLKRSRTKTEDLTTRIDGLKESINDGENQRLSLREEVTSCQHTIDSLRKELHSQAETIQLNSLANSEDGKRVDELKDQLKQSRTEAAELRCYIEGRNADWQRLNADLADLTSQLAAEQTATEKLSLDIEERNDQLVRSREQCIRSSEQLTQNKRKVRKLGKENRSLSKALHDDAENEIKSCRKRIARQSGEIAAQTQELDGIRNDNERIQKYADSLRIQLQDHLSISKDSVANRHELETKLDAANEKIAVAAQQLDDKRAHARELNTRNGELAKGFEREVRQIRFELSTAQETLTDQETINERLASELVDHQGFRQALELQLDEAEKQSDRTIRELNQQLKKATQDIEDHERKIRIKDNAISDLMKELSGPGDEIKLGGDDDGTLQGIDGFRTGIEKKKDAGEKGRVTRLLVGNADGRELRFPLFKDRLTIGRTSHNDIQLNMQFVSRRHAVISADNSRTRVIDWGSKNGVFVNEKRVTEKVLHNGDVVTIGTTSLKYEELPKR